MNEQTTLFYEDFAICDEAGNPYNILIERNSALEHPHAVVKKRAFHIMVNGNKHLAVTPPLKDFTLSLDFQISPPSLLEGLMRQEEEFKHHIPGFVIFFRYNRATGAGYALECLFLDEQKVSATLFAMENRISKKELDNNETPFSLESARSGIQMSFKAQGNNFSLAMNGIKLEMTDKNSIFQEGGYVGLDKTHYGGELIIGAFRISSPDKAGKSEIMRPVSFDVPCVHGMSVPYKFELNLFKLENGPYELNIKLSGGVKDRLDGGSHGSQWTFGADQMQNPYLRLDTPDGEFRNIILYNGLMTLFDREEKRYWVLDKYENIQWPLEKKVYFEALPDIEKIVFTGGYECFCRRPKMFLAGGSYEVMADSCGNRLYHGSSLRRGQVAVLVKSPEDKLVCARIPANVPDRERAIRHARENHYFYEKEKAVFFIYVFYHSGIFFPGEFELSARVESVYGDLLKGKIVLAPVHAEKPFEDMEKKTGITRLCRRVEIQDALVSGVYHLAINLNFGGGSVYSENTVFEIMSENPDAVPPPVASGLPAILSNNTETRYHKTDAFDPLIEHAGMMHYYSICMFNPDYAREKQIWKLIKFYNRKWAPWIIRRTTGADLSIDANRDIIRHCDFVNIPFENPERRRLNSPHIDHRVDLYKCDCYKGEVLEILMDFFKANPRWNAKNIISAKELETLAASGGGLSEEAFAALVDVCWNEWLEYFSFKFVKLLEGHRDKLKQINPNVEIGGSYGPFPIYGVWSRYTTADILKCKGYARRVGADKWRKGFFQFEDYPSSCGYSFTRGVFALMTIKLYYESWPIFPEIYGVGSITGCNDGAVADAHPPFGFCDLSPALVRERIYEYAFATCWFKKNQFHFWNDNGFHFSANHTKQGFKEFLTAWGNVRRHKPVRPARTACFMTDLDMIDRHPDYYDRRRYNLFYPGAVIKKLMNTANDGLACLYGLARDAGLPAGFASTFDDLENLTPEMTDLLILPPLDKKTSKQHLAAIRRLHQSGVSLIGFENVGGLEDLFGVKPLREDVNIRKISLAPGYAARLGGLEDEIIEHELCRAGYENNGATSILTGTGPAGSGNIPALAVNKTKWGRTAFFNIPPSLVIREAFLSRIGFGFARPSELVRTAAIFAVSELSSCCVKAPGAKVIAFLDKENTLIVIVEEESLAPDFVAEKHYPRTFMVEIKLPGIKSRDIISDKNYSVALEQSGRILLRLALGAYETAFLKINTERCNDT